MNLIHLQYLMELVLMRLDEAVCLDTVPITHVLYVLTLLVSSMSECVSE